MNLTQSEAQLSLTTTLPDGEYTDKVHGNKFTVKKGNITATLQPETSYVIY